MVSASLLVHARRSAGLSHRPLAARVGFAQREIERYERGRVTPSFERLRALIAVCDLELTVGLARADESYDEQIAAALALTPVLRPERAVADAQSMRAARAWAAGAPAPADVLGVLRAMNIATVRYGLWVSSPRCCTAPAVAAQRRVDNRCARRPARPPQRGDRRLRRPPDAGVRVVVDRRAGTLYARDVRRRARRRAGTEGNPGWRRAATAADRHASKPRRLIATPRRSTRLPLDLRRSGASSPRRPDGRLRSTP